MKLTPRHKLKPGGAGEAYKSRVKKGRTKRAEAKKTQARQRKKKRK